MFIQVKGVGLANEQQQQTLDTWRGSDALACATVTALGYVIQPQYCRDTPTCTAVQHWAGGAAMHADPTADCIGSLGDAENCSNCLSPQTRACWP